MHSHFSLIVLLFITLGFSSGAFAQEAPVTEPEVETTAESSRYFVSLLFGGAYNFETPLDINLDDREDIHFDSAEYSVRPFDGSFYYVLRAGWMDSQFEGWELELLHHKLYLEEDHPDIQEFTITDGYNGINVNKLISAYGLNFRIGGGVVLTHPETVIYGRKYTWDHGILDTGYHLSGVGLRATVGKFFALGENWFLETEAGLWATYTKIDVANGEATIPHASINADIGLGYFF